MLMLNSGFRAGKSQAMKQAAMSLKIPVINVRMVDGEVKQRVDWPFAAMKKGDSFSIIGSTKTESMLVSRCMPAASHYERTRGHEFKMVKIAGQNEYLVYRAK